MKNFIKTIIFAALLTLSANAFAAAKKSIVCVTFPEYDWIMNILGEKASAFDVTLLQNKGTDLHSYQPSVKDVAKISTCDLFVYVGGESDKWVEKILADAKNKKLVAVNMMEVLGDRVREEEIVEGMQAEEEEHHHDAEADGDEVEYDEHVWLSVKNAIIITELLSKEIQKLDSPNASVYSTNTETYLTKLVALDQEYQTAVAKAQNKTILFADRYPFRYLTDDYGLKYYAAFAGCSAESEASFDTIIFLAKKIDELGLDSVLIIEKSNKKIANTIVSSTTKKNQKILEMDSLQSITQKDINAGRNYLSAMTQNLEVLKKALK